MTENARSRTRARLEERERVILDAATKLFASAGFHATSTRKIAAAAGVSEGTVFHYFGSKNELMLGILDRFYNEVLNPRAADILDTIMDTHTRIRELAKHHTRALARDNALMMRLLQVYVGVDFEYLGQNAESPLRALNRHYVQHLDRMLREGMERDELRSDLSIRPVRDLFFGTLEYGLRTHVSALGTEGMDDYVDALIDPIWRGMARPSHASSSPDELIERLEQVCQQLESSAKRLDAGQ
ncbi:MAG: TetR/AcrR family transcriptional regulator [Congregibacter sp.]